MPTTPPQPSLRRDLGVGDAVVIGLGAMLGAGVFAAFGPAADAAGTGLLLALGLGIVVIVYGLVGLAVLLVLGAEGTAASTAPLRDAVRVGSYAELAPLVRVGAVTACLGVLLSAMAGVGRTTLAMARDRELPAVLDAVHPRFAVPHRAELLLGLVVIVVVSLTDIRHAIGFSSTGVLVYYAIANASAWTLPGRARRWRRPVAAIGLLGCTTLLVTLPLSSVVIGVAVLALGVLVRASLRRRQV